MSFIVRVPAVEDALVFVSNIVRRTNGVEVLRAESAVHVSNAHPFSLLFGSKTVHNADIEVGESILTADRVVVEWAMVTGGGLLTSAFGSFVHTSLRHDAVVLIGLPIDTANWSVIIRALEIGAVSNMGQSGTSLGQRAEVSIGLSVDTADHIFFFIFAVNFFTLAPSTKLFEVSKHDAGISIGDTIGGANRVVFVRAEVGWVEVGWAVTVGGEWDILAFSEAVVGVGDTIDTTDWHVFVRAMGAFTNEARA